MILIYNMVSVRDYQVLRLVSQYASLFVCVCEFCAVSRGLQFSLDAVAVSD